MPPSTQSIFEYAPAADDDIILDNPEEWDAEVWDEGDDLELEPDET